jgi:ligand-binding sensor domain-containing protein/signal transduction histidine kinase
MKYSPTNFRMTHRRFRHGLLVGVLLLPLVLTDRGFALDPAKNLAQYNCQTWTPQSGLPANGINAITQTKGGFIWLGSQRGLVRYDGVEFKSMELPRTRLFQQQGISSLSASTNGDLWFGFLNGAFGLCRRDSIFVALTNQTWVTPNMKVSAIMAGRDGALWVSSSASTMRWTTKSNTIQAFDFGGAYCNAMFEDSKGRLWLSMLGRGLFYFDGAQMNPFPDPGITNLDTIVSSIAEDHDGRFWFATQYGLRVYDADFHTNESPAVPAKVLCVLADREGTVWIGSDGAGLFCWRHGELTNFRKSDGLADDHVTALFEDREGNLWVGTRGGLNMFSDVKFPLYSPEGTEQNAAFHSVCPAAGGGVWAGSDVGLFRFDGSRFTYYGTNAGLTVFWLKQVFEASNGDLYVADGTQNAEILRDGKVVARHKCPTWPTGFAEDKLGVVTGSGDHLFRVNPGGLTPYPFTNAAPDFGWIRSLNSTRDGTILVAGVNGVFRVKDGACERFSIANGLPVNEALWVCEDSSGVLWAGLAGGVVRIEGNHVDSWTHDNGLFDNYVRAIIPDDDGWLWFHSDNGIFRARRDSFMVAGHKAERLHCEVFDGKDDVKTLETADVEFSACKTHDGRIWIPSPQGIILIDPAHLPPTPALPAVHIEKIRINGQEWSRAHGSTVPPGRGELEVQYTAPMFIAPQHQQFRYRLEGYETKWEFAGTRRSAFFANLKPGTYKFLVQACDADGLAGGASDSVKMELLPFFYQTIWFYLLGGVLVLVALGGSYAWRVRHLMHKQRALQKARDLLEAEVAGRTRELATANASLQHEEAQLKQRTQSLEKEIEERKRMEGENKRIHRELLEKSRQAGMAEIATNVLHNIGNVLNSVNVSASLVVDSVKQSKAASLAKVAAMMREHEHDLGTFITRDAKGRQLPVYLGQLSEQLLADQKAAVQELGLLVKNVEHINDVVAMQQSYARVSGLKEMVSLADLVEDSLRMNEGTLNRHQVEIIRKFEDVPPMNIEKHKVLQVLLNLIRNAKYACDESGREDKQITVSVADGDGRIKVSVSDNGIGIPPENLTRIFNHGFTTRKDGHGFGLHSGALAAKEMGGSLTAHSDGIARGATFTLELPVRPGSTTQVLEQ